MPMPFVSPPSLRPRSVRAGRGHHHFQGSTVSWQLTVNDLDDIQALPDSVLDSVGTDNPAYTADAGLAFKCAKQAGLVSVTLSGGRTPSPYGGPDTVIISVVGFSDRRQSHAVPPAAVPNQESDPYELSDVYGEGFYEMMARTIGAGPDTEEDDDAGSGAVRLPDPASGEGGSDGH